MSISSTTEPSTFYSTIEYLNKQGKICAGFYAFTSIFTTFEFTPWLTSFIYSLITESMNNKLDVETFVKLNDDEKAYFISAQAYQSIMFDVEKISMKSSTSNSDIENINRSPFKLELTHNTNCIFLYSPRDNEKWIAFSGLDIKEFSSIGAIGSLYYEDASTVHAEMKGKIVSSFIVSKKDRDMFQNEIDKRTLQRKSTINVIGHSMGSALATIMAYYFSICYPDATINLYGYAPIAFYDRAFKEGFEERTNINVKIMAIEHDYTVRLFNIMKITNKNPYKNFSIDQECIPYTYQGESVQRDSFQVEDTSLVAVLNPLNYIAHGMSNFEPINADPLSRVRSPWVSSES